MAEAAEIQDARSGAFTIRLAWSRLVDQIARATRRADAEDLLHDAYAGLLDRGTAPANTEAFLVHAARNRARDAWRREGVRGRYDDPTALDGIVDGQPLQDEMLIMRQRLERVRKGVDELTPRTREIFLMQRLDGCSYRQIAEWLAISQSAVEKHMAKAMAHLADRTEGW